MIKKRLLIISATAGLGHIKAAAAIEEVFKKKYPEIDVINKDILDFAGELYRIAFNDGYVYLSSKLPKVWKWFYQKYNDPHVNKLLDWISRLSISKNMFEFIKEIKPDMIVSTNPLPNRLIADAKDEEIRKIPMGMVVTDFGVHAYWFCEETDFYFVGSQQTKDDVVKYNVPASRVFITGIPINQLFKKRALRKNLYPKYGLQAELPTLLIYGGAIKFEDLEKIIRGIKSKNNKTQILVIAGRNKELQEKFAKNELLEETNVKLFGYVQDQDMLEIMSLSDLILTKTGGLITSECLALGLPIVGNKVIPGQEEDNLNFLTRHNAGIRADTVHEAIDKIDALLKDDKKLAEMAKNAKSIGKPNSADDIAKIIIKKIQAKK